MGRLFYEQQLSKTQIAERLRITITHVNRLLREAVRRGVVKISIDAPNIEILELELRERFGLVDAVVVDVPEEDEYLRPELGNAAAKYFEERVKDDSRVGIGSGRTLFEMVSILTDTPRNIKVFPLAVVAQQEMVVKSVDANTVVNAIWFKSRPAANAFRFEIFFPEAEKSELDRYMRTLLKKPVVDEYVRQLSDLDFYMFSCSDLRRDSHLIGIAASCGLNFGDLQKKSIIGDFVFDTVDGRGEHVSTCIETRRIGIDTGSLRTASAKPDKKVVLVAGGKRKFPVIWSGLRGGLFNVLITDSDTAKELIAKDT